MPDDVASGKIKPCINQPEELAKASLVTLPMMPQGMKNSLFWFAWSEVKWTTTIRKQFEDKSHREQYMQPFDMDAWLNSQSAAQALPLAQLDKTVAEYHQHARKSQMRGWSTTLLSRAVDGLVTLSYQLQSRLTPTASGKQVEAVANQELHPNGAMLVLQDPTGILKDLPVLIKYELDKNVYKRPDIEREIMLYATITSLKEGMTKDFQLNFMSKTLGEAALINSIDAAHPEGDITATLSDNELDSVFIRNRQSVMVAKTQAHWAEYEQYYKPHTLNMFNLRFQDILQEYNTRVVHPRTQLYLNWFQSPVLVNYFMRHFDANDLLSGMAYTATLTYCVANMMDKKGALTFFSESLLRDFTDPSNIVARGLALNQDALIKKIQETAEQSTDWWALPWNSLVDAVKEVVDKADLGARDVISIYTAGISAAIMHITTRVLGSQKVYAFMVSLGIFQISCSDCHSTNGRI